MPSETLPKMAASSSRELRSSVSACEPSQRAGKDTGDSLQETGVVTREPFEPAGERGNRAEWIVGRADAHGQTGASAVLEQQPIRNEATLGGEVVDDDHAASGHREIRLRALARRHCDRAQNTQAKPNSGGEAHRVRVRREFHDADKLSPKDAHDDGARFGQQRVARQRTERMLAQFGDARPAARAMCASADPSGGSAPSIIASVSTDTALTS